MIVATHSVSCYYFHFDLVKFYIVNLGVFVIERPDFSLSIYVKVINFRGDLFLLM